MRTAVVCASLFLALVGRAQTTLRINELQASNSTVLTDDGHGTPDWVELFNPGPSPVDLEGMSLVMAGRQHRFLHSLIIAPHGHLVLWCDGEPARGIRHIGFTLPRQGGALLLVAKDGLGILDSFTWKDMPHGVSLARMPDGQRTWGYAEEPTAGQPNPTVARRTRRAEPPRCMQDTLADGSIRMVLEQDAGDTVRYTLDGSPVSDSTATRYTGAITLAPGSVVRYRTMSENALPSAEGMLTVPRQATTELLTTLAMDPEALYGDSSGIDTPGLFANNTRRGKAWERKALVGIGASAPVGLGIRISGSGSRGLAKRSFKLYARGRNDSPVEGIHIPQGAPYDEAILRADASPNAFLRNRFIEATVQRHGLAVDVQPSIATSLYLNGRYWGLYRWLPPKDAAWCKAISGAEAVDVLAGPSLTPISGSGDHFLQARDALIRGAPMDSLEALMDLNSLLDLACVDLWTGRPDHDLNVRCYRPRQVGGRWRWILYDMDLWCPVELNSVEGMCATGSSESPYVKHLLAHPELQERLLARMVVLQATAFEPQNAIALVDSIHAVHESELIADHRRWELELDKPHPLTVLENMRQFISGRGHHVMKHLADHSGRTLRTVTLDVPEEAEGRLYLDGVALRPGLHRIRCFTSVPLELHAVPANDREFAAWKGVVGNGPKLAVDPAQCGRIQVLFRTMAP